MPTPKTPLPLTPKRESDGRYTPHAPKPQPLVEQTKEESK